MKKLLIAFAGLFCFSLLACHRSPQKTLLDQIKAKGELVIATEGVWEPWNFHDESGELVGYDIEIAKEMCARMGLRAKFLEIEWERLLNSLEKRECDIVMNGVAVTPERQARFYYTDPYAFGQSVLIARKDNNAIESFEDLAGKTSANSQGSTYEEIATKYGAIPIVIDTFEETVNLLLENRVDTTINSFFTFSYYMKNNPNAAIKVVAVYDQVYQIAIPCRRNPQNLTLLLEMNKALESMRSDGTLERISLKYFGQDVTK